MKICNKCKESKSLDSFYKHSTNRDGLQGHCKSCHNIWRKNQYIKNKEQELSRNKEWRENNKDKQKVYWRRSALKHKESRYAYTRSWISENKERMKTLRNNWREQNKEYVLEKAKDYHHNNRELRLDQQKLWKQNNKAKLISYRMKRIENEKLSGNNFTKKEWLDLCVKYNGLCLCCGQNKKLTADHIVPISKGGSNGIENIQPLCLECNQKKHTKNINYRVKDPQ